MTGLVLVSHSRALAQAAAELVAEVGKEGDLTLPIAFAGGTGENHAFLGTDATDIMDAVTSVYSDDGVLVLMDMGSSVLSARLAAELLGVGYKIKLSSAPLVEGAIVAAVQMKAGYSLEELSKEASAAITAKEQATGSGEMAAETASAHISLDGALSFKFRIGLEHGLHTRPQALLVGTASRFQSQIFLKNITKNKPPVNAKSMNKLSVYGVSFGDEAEILVLGADGKAALATLERLVQEHFSPLKSEISAPPSAPAKEKLLRLRAISGGAAIGKVYCADTTRSVPDKREVPDARKEVLRFEQALKVAEKRIRGFKANLLRMGLKSEAAIFDAHVLILYDEDLLNEVKSSILNQGLSAEYLYMKKMRELSEELSHLPDAYMRERAADIEDVAGQTLIALTGSSGERTDEEGGEIILMAREVSPALLGRWGAGMLKGVIMEDGGESSHAAIIARALGIPCVSGYPMPKKDMTGITAILDADAPKVIIPAKGKDIDSYRVKEDGWKALRLLEEKERSGEAVTLDGLRIEVLANASNVVEAKTALENGAAGIGLLRSEFLFMSKKEAPTEDEQAALLREIFAAYGEKPVTVRTLDIGGDKRCDWLNLPHENNPFLGVRGIRLCYREKVFFKAQIRAILRAGAGFNAKIMVPMVSVAEEIEFARKTVEEAHKELTAEGAEHLWPVRLGIMIETPAAVFMAREFASMVDFFSIGTNDLGQYIMCAERGNEFDFDLTGDFQPARLKAVKLVAEEAERAGIPLSVCGEMAGQPDTARALLALGVRCLSLGSAGIGRIKRTIRGSDIGALEKLLPAVLVAKSSSVARKIFTR